MKCRLSPSTRITGSFLADQLPKLSQVGCRRKESFLASGQIGKLVPPFLVFRCQPPSHDIAVGAASLAMQAPTSK